MLGSLKSGRFYYLSILDGFVKSHFANDIEQFWKKIQNQPGVEDFRLLEGAGPSFSNLAR